MSLADRMAAARADVVTRLRAVDPGVNVFDHKPGTFAAPAVFVVPGEPWLTYGSPGEYAFGRAALNFDLVLVAAQSTNGEALAQLERMAAVVHGAYLEDSEAQVGDLEAPLEGQLAGLGAAVMAAIPLVTVIDLREP